MRAGNISRPSGGPVELAAESAFSVEDLPLARRRATLTSDEELAAALATGTLWCALDQDVVGCLIALWLGSDLKSMCCRVTSAVASAAR